MLSVVLLSAFPIQTFAQMTIAIFYASDGTITGTVTSNTYVDPARHSLSLFPGNAPYSECVDLQTDALTVTNGVYRFGFSAKVDPADYALPPTAFAYGTCFAPADNSYAYYRDKLQDNDYYHNNSPIAPNPGDGLTIEADPARNGIFKLTWNHGIRRTATAQ